MLGVVLKVYILWGLKVLFMDSGLVRSDQPHMQFICRDGEKYHCISQVGRTPSYGCCSVSGNLQHPTRK